MTNENDATFQDWFDGKLDDKDEVNDHDCKGIKCTHPSHEQI